MFALEVKQAVKQIDGTAHTGRKPNPAAIAIRLGLRLQPVVGATYSFDGETITYDARQPLELQRTDIARACVVHLMHSRLRQSPDVSLTDAARAAFELED